jgi:hypothetical protein
MIRSRGVIFMGYLAPTRDPNDTKNSAGKSWNKIEGLVGKIIFRWILK